MAFSERRIHKPIPTDSAPGIPLEALWVGAVLLALIALLCTAGCEGDGSAEESKWAVEKTAKAKHAEMTFRLDRDAITTAEGVTLSISVAAPVEADIEFPDSEAKSEENIESEGAGEDAASPWGEWRVASVESVPDRMGENDRLVRERRYRLVPFLPGEYPIPAQTVTVKAKGADEATQLVIPAIQVSVASVLAGEKDAKLKDIAPPVELAGLSPETWRLLVVAAVLIAAGLGAAVYFATRSAPMVEAYRKKPHEIAYEELARLRGENLLEKGEVKRFYLELSGILRRYVENRFGLRAPERTTEEFLDDLRGSRVLADEQKRLLRAFLEHCDLVKFAAHRPAREESDESLAKCRAFVDETKAVPAADEAEGSARHES